VSSLEPERVGGKRVAVITISPDQITKKKRKGPKGHAVDLTALDEVQKLLGNE
jgi:formate dehydrogenase